MALTETTIMQPAAASAASSSATPSSANAASGRGNPARSATAVSTLDARGRHRSMWGRAVTSITVERKKARRPMAPASPRVLPATSLSLIRDFVANKEQKEKWSIDPDSTWHTAWDLFMVFLLAFVAIALPIELAFLSENEKVSFEYWCWNRFIDAAFLLDLVLNFFLGFEDENEGNVERDVRLISRRYFRTWFAIDFVSVLPFFLFDEPAGAGNVPGDTAVTRTTIIELGDNSSDALRVLTALRLLRVLKIVRLLRASRIIKRWEDRFSFRSTIVEPIKYIFLLIFVIHCMACVLELVSNMAYEERFSWEDFYLADDATASASTKYLSALYWSCMTVTTIGYGDLVPRNSVETWTASVIVFVGSCIYAYVVGTIVASLSGANPAEKDFQRDLENLDDFMHLAHCTPEHKWRLRAFFSQRGLIGKDKYFKAVLHECSPEIQANLAALLYKDSLLEVKFMQPPPGISEHREHHFIGQVSMMMNVEAFPAHEFLITKGEATGNLSKMYIIRRGLVGSRGRVFSRERGKNVLGADIICRHQMRLYSAKSLTFVAAVSLRSRDLHGLLDQSSTFAAQARVIAKYARWEGFRNIMQQILSRIKQVRVLASVAGVEVDLTLCPNMLFARRGQPFDAARAIRRMLRAKALAEHFVNSPRSPRSPRSQYGPWSRALDSPTASPRARSRSGSFADEADAKHASKATATADGTAAAGRDGGLEGTETSGGAGSVEPLVFVLGKDGEYAAQEPRPPVPGLSGYRGEHDRNGLSWEERDFCVRVARISVSQTSPKQAVDLLRTLRRDWSRLRSLEGTVQVKDV